MKRRPSRLPSTTCESLAWLSAWIIGRERNRLEYRSSWSPDLFLETLHEAALDRLPGQIARPFVSASRSSVLTSRSPATFYANEWEKILGMAGEIRAFIRENEGQLKRK